MQNQAKNIRDFILKIAPKHPHNLVGQVISHFNVTATTVHRHINVLIKEGRLVKSGQTRSISYFLTHEYEILKIYGLSSKLSEDRIFTVDLASVFNNLPQNIYKICSFAITEMINNAIDHSLGTKLWIQTKFEKPYLLISIKDDGIGAFKKICNYLNITDVREGILHLSKGKMTTDPANHTGQGIFFASRMFDIFKLKANDYLYLRDNIQDDCTFVYSKGTKGTEIEMILNINTVTNIKNIFSKYEDDDFAFDKTEIMVDLAKFKEEYLVSRSQAKRILLGLEKFKRIMLDFKKIDFVGQGFVDEVFRVFQNKNPDIEIKYVHANSDVEFMIKRGLK